MIILKHKNSFVKFILYYFVLFLVLFVIVNLFDITNEKEVPEVETSIIQNNEDNYSIYVEYPRFHDDKIDTIITDIIYSYVKEFKYDLDSNRSLDMSYELFYYEDYVNITFHIENTTNNIKNRNILINLDKKEIAYITNIFDKDYLNNQINDFVYYKYSNDIYELIKDTSLNNHTYILNDKELIIYFNDIKFESLDYIPYINISLDDSLKVNNDVVFDENKKYIAFTYDDGPGEYTLDLLKTLEVNNSSATFFMIGNRMKNYNDLVLEIYKSNSEIGSHTYSHKDLSLLSNEDIINEINSTNIIYNNITNDTLKYLRPPYNNYNADVLNKGYEIVTWNIDTKDWINRDSEEIYNNVIENACDGCIVLMHDIYEESIEATKKLLPKLHDMGYEVVSISDLARIKEYDFTLEDVTSMMKDDE